MTARRDSDAGAMPAYQTPVHQRDASIMDGYRRSLELIAQGESLAAVLDALTRTIEEQLGHGALASILLRKDNRLYGVAAPGLPRDVAASFEGVMIGPAVGSCGTAAYRRQPVIVTDIAADPLWEPFRDIALRHGLRACWSVPIFSGDQQVLGTFAIYYRYPRRPSDPDLQVVQTMARAASIAIERDRAGQALRETERRLRATFDHAAVGIAHVDLDGRWIDVNQRLCDIVGYAPEEITALTFQEMTHPDDLQTDLSLFRKALAGEIQTYAMEKRYIRKDRSIIWINLTVSLVRDAQGRPQYFISVIEDISHRKLAEQQLVERARQQQQLYQLALAMNRARDLDDIYQAALDVILNALTADRASILVFDDDHVMQFRAWRGLSGSYRRAVTGHSPWTSETANPRPISIDDVRTSSLDPGLRQLLLDEGIRALSFIPLMYQGRLRGKFMVYYNDPHQFDDEEIQLSETIATQLASAMERKRSEQDLRVAKEQSEAANAAKDRFLAVLSHELRTPLSPVVMAVAAMEDHPALPQDLKQDLAMIRRNIALETKLIDDLLDLSRVVNGKLRLHIEPVQLHELLEHVLASCAPEAEAAGLTIHRDLQATIDRVLGDPARLQQVFWNLLKNALKFTPAGGRISVRSDDAPDGHIRIQISDTGVGIAPDLLPRLFNAFEQGDGTSTTAGLGLGLAISRAVIELHGGTIHADSPGQGEGTTFTVQFKTANLAAREHQPPPRPKDRTTRVETRILLVEDHADSAITLARLLSRSGYTVKTADSVAAALQLVAREPFDILISDIGLPDATGYDLMKQIGQQYQIKGIALSGYGMENDMQRSRDAGFVDHVVKPVNVAQLEALIQRITAESDPSLRPTDRL